MPIDLVALDEKIKKLQLIRQLAADPELGHLLNDVMNGNGAAARTAPKPLTERKGVRYDVLKYVVHPSDLEGYRTARQITSMMEEAKYKFKSKDHGTTVRESLRELERERLVEKAGTNSEDGAALWRKTI
ncbi:MAG: hypothetical protein WB919_01705 [Candidatus Sulfotelmatobacter sp.]